MGLGLGTEEFSRLFKLTSIIQGVGGSIIGGGKGGSTLLYASKPENITMIKSMIYKEPMLTSLPLDVFDQCVGAKILR